MAKDPSRDATPSLSAGVLGISTEVPGPTLVDTGPGTGVVDLVFLDLSMALMDLGRLKTGLQTQVHYQGFRNKR